MFTASALYCALMLLPTIFVYRTRRGPASTKTLKQVLLGAAEVLGDSRFMLMIVVYSGFWILYFQNFGSVLWYLRDFIDSAPVSAADDGLLARDRPRRARSRSTPSTSRSSTPARSSCCRCSSAASSRRQPALPTMVTGMSIGAVGFLLLASSHNAVGLRRSASRSSRSAR